MAKNDSRFISTSPLTCFPKIDTMGFSQNYRNRNNTSFRRNRWISAAYRSTVCILKYRVPMDF